MPSTGAGAPVSGSLPLAVFGNAMTSRIDSRPARSATILSMLAITLSAGSSIEEAVARVSDSSEGELARELQRVRRELRFGQRYLVPALIALAERNRVPELSTVVGHIQAASRLGLPLTQVLGLPEQGARTLGTGRAGDGMVRLHQGYPPRRHPGGARHHHDPTRQPRPNRAHAALEPSESHTLRASHSPTHAARSAAKRDS